MKFCFLGSFTHSIDSQRRVAIPREWRFNVADPHPTFYLLPGRNFTIQVIPKALFEDEVLGKLRKVSFADEPKTRALARIGAKASQGVCDKQGRIKLTQGLLDHAGLRQQAVLIGGITNIQIMTVENWKKSDMGNDEMLDQIQRIQDLEGL